MVEIKKVVIPVDFSSNTDSVVAYGLSMADKLDAQVLFINVVSNFQGYATMQMYPSFYDITQNLEKEATERMDTLVKKYAQREKGATGNVIIGDAADEIINFAKLEKADMIIIGTHGFKGLDKILLGSTAKRVVKKALCPVLVFNPFN